MNYQYKINQFKFSRNSNIFTYYKKMFRVYKYLILFIKIEKKILNINN